MTRPRLILFDMDGTLVDSQHVIVDCMRIAYGGYGLTAPAREEILGIVGLSLHEAVLSLSPDMDPGRVPDVVAAYKNGFVARRAQGVVVPLYEGAEACLRHLHAVPEAVLGVATGKARRGVDHTVDSHGLHGLFTTVQTADDHPSKPHPSMVLTACAQTGIAPEDTVIIGDTSFDMDMGRAAGVGTIAVSWGYHGRDRLAASGPDHVVEDFDALRRVLAEFLELEAPCNL